jgi:hypothetical protein
MAEIAEIISIGEGHFDPEDDTPVMKDAVAATTKGAATPAGNSALSGCASMREWDFDMLSQKTVTPVSPNSAPPPPFASTSFLKPAALPRVRRLWRAGQMRNLRRLYMCHDRP